MQGGVVFLYLYQIYYLPGQVIQGTREKGQRKCVIH
jgi:hypothetical protein